MDGPSHIVFLRGESRQLTVDHDDVWHYWQDDHQRLVYVSPGCERTTGYAPTEFLVEPGLIDRIVRVCTCRTFARSRF